MIAAGVEARILVVAPTGRDAGLLSTFLREHRIVAKECESLAQAAEDFRTGAGAILVADEAFREESSTFAQALKAQPAWSDVPILLLTFAGATPAVGDEQLEQLGNVTVIERPVRGGPLLSAVQSALRARRRQYEVRDHVTKLEIAERDLRTANERKDELLALVSHELRTPLTLIVGSGELLSRRGDSMDQFTRQELISSVTDNGARLKRIIENMLVLAKAETAEEVVLEPLLLQRVLPTVLNSLRPLKGSRDLRAQVPESLPPVIANAVFFEQIVQNLVRNSEKYAAADTPVDVSVDTKGGIVEVAVADRGRSFDEAEVERMFENFYRDPETCTRVGGLGLGLPVCRRLAEVQHGSIDARPRDGGGIVVTLGLQVATS